MIVSNEGYLVKRKTAEKVEFGSDYQEKPLNKRTMKMTSAFSVREIPVKMSKSLVEAKLAEFLYATKKIKHSDDVIGIDIGELDLTKGTYNLTVKVRKEGMVNIINF